MGTTAEKLTYLNTTKGKIKDGINSLGGSIDSNTTFRDYATQLDSIYNRLPKVSGTGSNITLTPTLKGRLGSVLKGDTFQQTYSGKNLFDINATPTWIGGDTTYSINNNVLKVQGNWYVGFLINIKENTDYYLSATKNIITSQSGTGNIAIYTSNKQTLIKLLRNDGTFNSGGNNQVYLVFYSGNGNAGEVEFSNIQLEEGSSATSYEPYVGGQASPNPIYPQNIQCVEGIQNISVYGKNILNASQESYICEANKALQPLIGEIELKANIKYYISYNIDTQMTSNTRSTPMLIINSTNYFQDVGTNKNLTVGRKVWEFTPSIDGIYTLKYWSHTPDVDLTISDFMVSTSSDTTYVPYQTPQTQEINLGDIKLYNGDYITGTPDNWSIVRENGEVVLDGTEIGWFGFRGSDETYSYRVFGNTNLVLANANANVKSNYFTKNLSAILNANENGIYIYVANALYISIDKNLISSVEPSAFKTWLSTHNTEVVYKLATPTTEPITDTNLIGQLNALYNAKSYNGQTNISVSGNLPMIIEASALKGEI